MHALLLALGRLLAAAWLLAVGPAWAQDVLPVPALGARVIDQTATLSAAQRAAIEDKLAAFEKTNGTQIVVLMVPSTAPEDIAAYAQRVADTWKIGRREVGDGLLVVVAKNDRRIRIEVAKALEGAVPDLAARQIIDRRIAPAFRAGDFAGGIDAGIDALIARIRGEGLPAPDSGRAPADEGPPWQEAVMFFFIAVFVIGGILSTVLGRRLGSIVTSAGAGVAAFAYSASVWLAVAAALAALVLLGIVGLSRMTGMARRGTSGPSRGGPWAGHGGGFGGGFGGGGGLGGGGFGSGGGGDFGGGGASGDW
jgi:uncharacterized protein